MSSEEFPLGDEWITVPFRILEAARVTIHVIGANPDVPDPVRWWIAKWLSQYNSFVAGYMKEIYGADIFPLLDRVTMDVLPNEYSDGSENKHPSWELWEQELNDREGK
jgi:hypothetical protein